jgi:nucleotide-binding universal stress UspA family protein
VVAEPTAPAVSSPFNFDTILVPLDGILSEVVLGPVSFLARRLGSRVTLVHVSEEGLDDANAGGAPEVVGQRAAADPLAERYLYRGADTLRREGVAVDTLVLTGKADRAIVDWARERKYGLVAMATYSRGGGARTEPGHVTTQVLRACPVPLLLSCPGNGDLWAAPCHISRLLVPLDGSPLAEEALPYAAQLALQLALPLTLIQVISASRQPVAAISEPAVNNIEPRPIRRQSFSDHPLQLESQLDVSTTSYLSGVCQKLADRGIVTAWHAPWGAPPDAIIEQVRQDDGTLVVMASHGGSGPDRASVGSVTSAVIRAARAPILTVPPRRESPRQ